MEELQELLLAIARQGRRVRDLPALQRITPFRRFFSRNGTLKVDDLDRKDGRWTRRELLTRCLMLSAVLDQGPDIAGVRTMTRTVISSLYKQRIRVFHQPDRFFRRLSKCADIIVRKHDDVKRFRAKKWARANKTNPARYNLFLESTQVLNYAVSRWGVPLGLPIVLQASKRWGRGTSPLVDYLESYPSAEKMSSALKDDRRHGLGKAIGDKACHLFAKWFCYSFRLTRRSDAAWGPFSFEAPFDSNAGRVLWRTGFLGKMGGRKDYKTASVIQPGRGKGGLNYLRITNIRGMEVSRRVPDWIANAHSEICVNHMRTHKRRPRKIQIQRVPHALLLPRFADTGLGVADLDEGLIYIGTSFCFNHDRPNCSRCPVSRLCEGYNSKRKLITSYRT